MPEPLRHRRSSAQRLAALLACLGAMAPLPAQAQLGLPGVGAAAGALPGALGSVRERVGAIGVPAERDLQLRTTALVPMVELRRRNIATLLRQHADRLEADPTGEPVVRSELLLVSPAPGVLVRAVAQGYRWLREETLEGLDLRSVVLQPPPGMATADALASLRALDPRLDVDFNHVYLRGASAEAQRRVTLPAAAPAAADAVGRRVGLIDSGIDPDHPALRAVALQRWGCGGRAVASPHGTAVASLLVGRDGAFRGVLPGASLHAADVYCGAGPTGGSAEAVAQALAWMARERVAVVNVSLVGAPNRLLERAVQALQSRGHLVVAAVGNDGPAAPPLYPASYPGVVGVTGTTPRRQVLPEAAQGPQVVLAAPGAEVVVARSVAGDYVAARGTSFAAPLVAGLLADLLRQPDPAAARAALERLVERAADLGRPGRDTVYGHGLVDAAARLQLARPD